MEQATLIYALVAILMMLICCGVGVFMLLLVLGVFILRKRGQKDVSMKDAVATGAETVSQVFVRGQGGLEALGDDDED